MKSVKVKTGMNKMAPGKAMKGKDVATGAKAVKSMAKKASPKGDKY